MKNKIKKFLSICILVPTLVLSPIQTQAFAISGMITLGMFVNFLVSTVIVTGVVYEFTNGAPVIGYTDYKDILTKNDTSKYKFDNSSLLAIKSATDLVTMGLTPLEADNIVEAYDEYCAYYEDKEETSPYTFKNTSVFTSTVSLAKSLNYVVSDVDLPTLTPSIVINETNFSDYMTYDDYVKLMSWEQVYYYVFLGSYSVNGVRSSAKVYNQILKGEVDFNPCVLYSNVPYTFYGGNSLFISSSNPSRPALVVGYDDYYRLTVNYINNVSGSSSPSYKINGSDWNNSSVIFQPPVSTSESTSYYGAYLLATNDETYASSYSSIPADVISKNLISVTPNDMPFVNKIAGSLPVITDIVIPYKPVSTITVLPGSIALSPSSVDEYKNSIVADESFSLTLPVEDVIAPPVDGTQDLSGILEFLQKILDGILAIPRAITQTITDFFSAQPTTTIDFSPLFISLADKFPFCLPFDLFNAFKSFAAAPEVPRFEITFDKGLVGAGSFTFDFAPFTKLAAILRYFILLVFVTSLINKTKNMIN